MATVFSKHDAGGGGIGTFADPFTLQELIDAVDGNATTLGLVCATGNYTPSVTIDFDINAGTLLLPNVIRGANADGSDDGTIATILGTSLGAGDDLLDFGIAQYTTLEGLRITGATQYNIFCDQNAFLDFKTCQFDAATQHNMYVTSTGGLFRLFKCDVFGSVNGSGLAVNAAARGRYHVYRCKMHHNKLHGIHDGSSAVAFYAPNLIEDCSIYRNEGDGVNHELSGANYVGPIIRGTVMAFNLGDGFAVANIKGNIIFENNIGKSNGGYFINTNTGTIKQIVSCKNNCSYNNTSGHIDINSNVLPGTGHIYQDPLFVSETDGSEDFGLQSGSPCLNAAIDGGIWYP